MEPPEGSLAAALAARLTGKVAANTAINAQYALFGDHYLWAPEATAFTVVPVP